jgi:hypothetical protein
MTLDCSWPAQPGVPCPSTVDNWMDAFVALFPRGFAWDALEYTDSLMYHRARVVAYMLQEFHEKACALPPEFRCHSADLTLSSWWADYGLPDACGITQLCPKVTWIGDGTCNALVEIGASLGYEVCCEELPVEIQAGCWNLGCDEMAPEPVYEKGGSELGFMSLGYCPTEEDGAPLGDATLGTEDCNIAGYGVSPPEISVDDPPCDMEGCMPWEFVWNQTWQLCHEPYELNYVGNAYHIKVGVKGTSSVLADPSYIQMGCWEMGCGQLCVPPVAELLCFFERHRHAHIKLIPVYC